jgi:uncharacterized membrane protein YqjE
VRGIWSLPKAAPALFRHFGAYLDLAALDLLRTRREITALVVSAVIIAISALFLVLLICLAIIAATWDTPYRVTAIILMAGGFLVVGAVAVIYLTHVVRTGAPFLADVRKEWQEDRVILERAFFPDKKEPDKQG